MLHYITNQQKSRRSRIDRRIFILVRGVLILSRPAMLYLEIHKCFSSIVYLTDNHHMVAKFAVSWRSVKILLPRLTREQRQISTWDKSESPAILGAETSNFLKYAFDRTRSLTAIDWKWASKTCPRLIYWLNRRWTYFLGRQFNTSCENLNMTGRKKWVT